MSAEPSFFVAKGLTRPFYIKANPGLYPEFKGEYTPLGAMGAAEFWSENRQKDPADAIEHEFLTVSQMVKSSNAGNLGPDRLKTLHEFLYARLKDILLFGAPSDVAPTDKKPPKPAADDEIEKKDD